MKIDDLVNKLRELRRVHGDKVEVFLQQEPGKTSEFGFSIVKPEQDKVEEGKPKPALKPDYLVIVKQ